MKKTTCLLLALSLLCIAGLSQPITSPYRFPVQPGSTEWQSFKSVDDMYRACQVPPAILARLTTKALIQTCLNYPARIALLAYNTPQQGFDDWKKNFNGIATFLQRSDAREELLLFYAGFDTRGHTAFKTAPDKGNYTYTLQVMEAILAQDEITNGLTIAQQKQLLKTSLEKYRSKQADEVYGFNSVTYTGRIISKLSVGLGNKTIKPATAGDVQQFIRTGLLENRQILLDMVSEARKIDTDK